MNHTSDEHRSFQASRVSRVGEYADSYLWRDPAGYDADGTPLPPNNRLSYFGGSAWAWEPLRAQFYMHTFLAEQPELNSRNPAVEAAQFRMVRGWLERGVDGFRLDVFNVFLKHPDLLANPVREGLLAWDRQEHLYDRDQPDFPDLIRVPGHPRRAARTHVGGGLFASEAERAVALTSERHLVFDWTLLAAPWSAEAFSAVSDAREALYGTTRWPANVLSNHDQSRQATRLAESAGIADTDAVARAAAVLLLTTRGTPFLLLRRGESVHAMSRCRSTKSIESTGAPVDHPGFSWWNRDQCRSPMPWTGDPGHGFSSARPWLRYAPDAATRNVEAQSADPGSVLATYRRILALRRATPALRTGTRQLVASGDPDILAWFREAADERYLIVVNFADEPRTTTVTDRTGEPVESVAGSHQVPSVARPGGGLALRPLEAVILRVG